MPDVGDRLLAFVIERFPFADALVRRALGQTPTGASVEAYGRAVCREIEAQAASGEGAPGLESTPGVAASERMREARLELISACQGFFERESIASSLTADERIEILRGMVLTRAVDTQLKQLFLGADVRYQGTPFQGKGFRSLGQEAIYAAAIRLRRGSAFRTSEGWQGDVVGPIIRDVGVALAMRNEAATVRMVLNAQMGKAGPPMDGKDLHIGDFDWGILPATAPLAISTMTIAGLALAFARERSGRVAISFIGEGGSSLGEWHEAINLCAARKLPAVFCVENNQIALSTPVNVQSAARVFADKALGYGIPGITIDGTDPDTIAAAFEWAAARARRGEGPTLIELVSMRMCGHAHHDDMLYLGKDTRGGWEYPPLSPGGYADPGQYEYWAARDPIATYAARLVREGVIGPQALDELKRQATSTVEREALAVVSAPWPDAANTADGVFARERPKARIEWLEPGIRGLAPADLPALDPQLPFDAKGRSFLEAIALGIADALRADERVFVFGQDVGVPYGNAFMLLRPLLQEFGDRIVDSPLAEGAVLGACIGAALAGQRPIAEMQFNDFVATGFNQLVNNAAKIRYRWGGSVPLVVRMPWGGLRHAGPYHSQNTEAWFYRTPGLKIAVPSTPQDARAMFRAAVLDEDPVLFYEHIALYRDPAIRQMLTADAPQPAPVGAAALRRAGSDLAIISYGAYVHRVMQVADRLSADGIDVAVLDLRWLSPLDKTAVLRLARHCSRVLIVHEDTRTGGIGESLAAIIQEEAFEYLDAPVRVIGALDTPVPYSPPLEEAFLPSEEQIERAARLLVAY